MICICILLFYVIFLMTRRSVVTIGRHNIMYVHDCRYPTGRLLFHPSSLVVNKNYSSNFKQNTSTQYLKLTA